MENLFVWYDTENDFWFTSYELDIAFMMLQNINWNKYFLVGEL